MEARQEARNEASKLGQLVALHPEPSIITMEDFYFDPNKDTLYFREAAQKPLRMGAGIHHFQCLPSILRQTQMLAVEMVLEPGFTTSPTLVNCVWPSIFRISLTCENSFSSCIGRGTWRTWRTGTCVTGLCGFRILFLLGERRLGYLHHYRLSWLCSWVESSRWWYRRKIHHFSCDVEHRLTTTVRYKCSLITDLAWLCCRWYAYCHIQFMSMELIRIKNIKTLDNLESR
jgi:hypothetical protein